jgi:hypothetical protein
MAAILGSLPEHLPDRTSGPGRCSVLHLLDNLLLALNFERDQIKEVVTMTNMKPEVVLLGEASQVIENPTQKGNVLLECPSCNTFNSPAYDLDE